jgi:1,4-alpha-glucan branching enzyme
MVTVRFRYLTGLRSKLFDHVRLVGSWGPDGRASASWSEVPMAATIAEDGCPAFVASVDFPDSQIGREFHWGVLLAGPFGQNVWGIPSELDSADDDRRHRVFVLDATRAEPQDYYFTFARHLGARKCLAGAETGLRFRVWAPHARAVEVVFAKPGHGYIFDDGAGIDADRPALALTRGEDGIWRSARLPDFDSFEGVPYMYRITTEQGEIKYRSDLYSRQQAGRGAIDPAHAAWDGDPATLDGSKACSVITGRDSLLSDGRPGAARVSREAFWQSEFQPGWVVPSRLEDLVIYELHVGSLGFGKQTPGDLCDARAFVQHLIALGVNAVELMPLSEFSGAFGWGYGDTHHMVLESSAGTFDDLCLFVRECHRHGIAVIQDVCYNHYDPNAERAQWQYDSSAPQHNGYYWYEGTPDQYQSPDGGYLDNGSSGWAPRYSERVVRQQFIAGAALLMDECHLDGFRVDLTQAFHRDNCLHANGASLPAANLFGQKFLREWSRTLRMIKPRALLIAEDHTGWDKVTASTDLGGLGFSARWDAAFYHHLIGDADNSAGFARVLHDAGFGGDAPLALSRLAGALDDSRNNRVVYHESHDEAGNSAGSARTLVAAVAGAALIDATRSYAEARVRVCFGLSLFSAGTAMFFMGEETGAQKPYRFDTFADNREDILGDRAGSGAQLFRFYSEAIALFRRRPSARSQDIDLVHVDEQSRVLAFVRRAGVDALLIVASLSNRPYLDGYVIQSDAQRLPDGVWQEVFNSDATEYGGQGTGNFGAAIPAVNGRFEARLPSNGFLVFWQA